MNESFWDAQGVEFRTCAKFDIFHGSVNCLQIREFFHGFDVLGVWVSPGNSAPLGKELPRKSLSIDKKDFGEGHLQTKPRLSLPRGSGGVPGAAGGTVDSIVEVQRLKLAIG